ncbi:MAG: nicotinate (nicotinamide) nucleotide adenylyltransferase [Oscillospiraceae bacterium]|nr:nicotinate (nicotinamide) nucleotide adenylyltransferase [Oscillospiraceae bacterium]
MKIGLYGGAFNPVHNGHLALAEHFKNALELERLIFIPTHVPPHKSGDGLVSGEHRINMLSLALSGLDYCSVSDIEFRREGKSYTYDTVCELKKIYPDDEFFLIVGADQYFDFQKWYRADELLRQVTVCSAARENNQYRQMLKYKSKHDNMQNTVVCNFDVTEISSSKIRNMISTGQSVTEFVPDSVLRYIKENNLYV